MEIKTKFSIGDTVYAAETQTTTKSHSCPDCNGSRKWKAISPAGGEYEITCPRCGTRYLSDNGLSLQYTVHVPTTRVLTIGSVQVNTHDAYAQNRYMCKETGIGSGTVHPEAGLHATKESALKHAEQLAAERNKSTEWVAKQYDASLEVCDFQLSDAKIQLADSRETARRGKVGDFLDAIDDCETMEDVKNLRDEHYQ